MQLIFWLKECFDTKYKSEISNSLSEFHLVPKHFWSESELHMIQHWVLRLLDFWPCEKLKSLKHFDKFCHLTSHDLLICHWGRGIVYIQFAVSSITHQKFGPFFEPFIFYIHTAENGKDTNPYFDTLSRGAQYQC